MVYWLSHLVRTQLVPGLLPNDYMYFYFNNALRRKKYKIALFLRALTMYDYLQQQFGGKFFTLCVIKFTWLNKYCARLPFKRSLVQIQAGLLSFSFSWFCIFNMWQKKSNHISPACTSKRHLHSYYV